MARIGFLDNIDHFLSLLSSSGGTEVQSNVAPSFDEVGTGCSGTRPTEGLKSTESVWPTVLCAADTQRRKGRSEVCRGEEDPAENEEDKERAVGGPSGRIPVLVSVAFKRASTRDLCFRALCRSATISGSNSKYELVNQCCYRPWNRLQTLFIT